jgi:hypothetical protein
MMMRMHEADGGWPRWQMADGRWQMAGSRWQMQVTVDGRCGMMADGRWQMAGGRCADGGRWQEAGGRWRRWQATVLPGILKSVL